MMRLFAFALITLIALPAHAQSRVVGDTFGTQRESHLQDTDKLKQQWLDDHAAGEGERTSNREKSDQEREAQRESSEKAAEGWFQNWNDAEGAREAALGAEDSARATHQSGIESRPEQWWGTDSFNQ
jgi:hypothetical protein